MASEKIKAQEARDLYILKQKAIQYYAENGLPQKMEEILNSTFYDGPNDVYGHITNFFEQFMITPTVTKVCGREVYDSNAHPTIQAEVYAMVKNFERHLGTTTSSSKPGKVDLSTLKPEERQPHEEERQKCLTDSLNMLKHPVNDALGGVDPTQQEIVDTKITEIIETLRKEEQEKINRQQLELEQEEASTPKPESPSKGKKSPKGKGGGKGKEVVVTPDEQPEVAVCGCAAISLASQAICEAAAQLKRVPTYKHIACLKYGGHVPDSLKLPLPVATILCSGKNLPGKQNYVTEYMVVPNPAMPYSQAYKYINKIYHHCAQSMSAKAGAITRNVNELGALCPTYDRTEQGLDLLQEAITSAGLTPGEDFNIMLNLAGPNLFDYEKGKYDVMVGTQKGPDDLADYWADITTKYPSVIAIIDPMRRVEKEAWMKLCERITEHCHVIGDVTHHRAGLLIHEEIELDWKTSGVVLNMQGQNTVTELMQLASKMEEECCEVIVGTSQGTSASTFPVDLAIGIQAKFIKLGAPIRGERVALYNYMLQVEEQLVNSGTIGTWEAHTFTLIKPPTPPPEEDPSEGDVSPTKDKKN